MLPLTRRSLLQATAATLTTIALSRTQTLLAQSARRKLALLIGIDAYEDGKPLEGCNTDVDLQRELLIHRYGFNPIDIVELRDRNATYQNIIDEFQKLIQTATPNDLVVFHFSGHGSRVLDRNPIADFIIQDPLTNQPVGLNGTIVPFDWKTSNPKEVRQIMGKTLYLLTTDRIVTILDCCHSEGGLRGNSNVRSMDSRMNSGSTFPTVIKEELELQKGLLPKNWTEETLQKKRSEGIAKGLSLGAASFDREANIVNPIALDLSSGDFRAGAFTYLLTRYLWQSPQARSIDIAFAQLSLSSTLLSSSPDQSPVYRIQPNQDPKQTLLYLVVSQS
jgi:Caspase domain